MPKSLWLVVAVVVAEALILLSAVVPRQFQDTLAISSAVLGHALLSWITEEVKCESGIRITAFTEERHAHNLLVELERFLSILDPDHGVVHQVGGHISLLHILRFFDGLATNDLDPCVL